MKYMYSTNLVLMITLLLSLNAHSMADVQSMMAQPEPGTFEGRWNITFNPTENARPGWLEIRKSGTQAFIGRVMIVGGSARPISEIVVNGEELSFTIPPQWDAGDDIIFQFRYADDRLSGTMRGHNGKISSWTAIRVPELARTGKAKWGKRIKLFNGTDLTGWTTQDPKDVNQWVAEDGVLRSPKSGANLKTVETFNDFQLHIEFRYPAGSNSGVYLRGRYEVQIEDNKGKDPDSHYFGGIYGLLTPNKMVARNPGEWQTFDITLVGRLVTVIANGEMIICNQLIPGITGGALDNDEEQPGPILLQGDHGPVEYRNIVLRPARR